MTLALVAITMYHPAAYGPITYCGTYCGTYVADAPPWVAVPVEWYESGLVSCGDRIGILADGEVHILLALDAGPFGSHCVRQLDGSCPPIAADVPDAHAWFPGLSTTGRVWSVTRLQEVWEGFR